MHPVHRMATATPLSLLVLLRAPPTPLPLYQRHHHPCRRSGLDPSDAGFRLVASLFALLKHKQHLCLSRGLHTPYTTEQSMSARGVTWLSLTFEQNNGLAFIPKEGIIEYNGSCGCC